MTRLSQEAYELAKAFASGDSDGEAQKVRARAIDRRLDELVPLIQAALPADQPRLTEAWNDARLDVGFVISGGTQPTSLRLAAHLRR